MSAFIDVYFDYVITLYVSLKETISSPWMLNCALQKAMDNG